MYKKAPWEVRAEVWLQDISKLCPRCGTFLPLDALGCSNCLLQFNKERKRNVIKSREKHIEEQQN